MKIAILTSGILPVPAVRGGAVENLTDFYLKYNEEHHLHDITVYSVWNPGVKGHPALQSKNNHYQYIKVDTLIAKLRKKVYQFTHGKEYYHYTIEYFLHRALKHISSQDYDIIITENRPGYALKIKDQTNTPLVHHLHNDILNNTTKNHQEIYDAAVGIMTVSDYIASRVRTINPQDSKCQTVLNGIDLHAFTNITSDEAVPHPFTLIFSGRLIPEKGILPLIQAMYLLKGHADIRLLILGSPSLGNTKDTTPFQQQLQDATKDLDNITFTGYVEYSKMGQYLHRADVAVLPSLWEEPFGLTCAEALAAGLPLITTRRGGIPEVADDSCAILLDIDEQLPEHIKDAVLNLYHHPEKRQAMSEAAQKRSLLFTKEQYAQQFFEALETFSTSKII